MVHGAAPAAARSKRVEHRDTLNLFSLSHIPEAHPKFVPGFSLFTFRGESDVAIILLFWTSCGTRTIPGESLSCFLLVHLESGRPRNRERESFLLSF